MMTTSNPEQGPVQGGPVQTTALAKQEQPSGDTRLLLHSDTKRGSVALGPAKNKRWQPPRATRRRRAVVSPLATQRAAA